MSRQKNNTDIESVGRAAEVLLDAYGQAALEKAREIEAHAEDAAFAAMVTAEVERRLHSLRH